MSSVALPYHYYQGSRWDPPHYYGVDPNSYDQVLPVSGSKIKVAQPVHCGVCKIECNKQEILEVHIKGKKHKKNLQKLQESVKPESQSAQLTTYGAEKMVTKILEGDDGSIEVAQRSYCDFCKVYCNSQAVLNIHEQGRKHKKIFQKLQYSKLPKPQKDQVGANAEEEKKAETNYVAQPLYCNTCSVFCNSQEVLNIHNRDRKHIKNLYKSQNSITLNQALGFRQTKEDLVTKKTKILGGRAEPSEVKVRQTKEDLETKKKKILGGGAAPSEMKVCAICNVVVNSQMVYNDHIAGLKHIAMVKKQQELAIVEGEKNVNSENVAAPYLASQFFMAKFG